MVQLIIASQEGCANTMDKEVGLSKPNKSLSMAPLNSSLPVDAIPAFSMSNKERVALISNLVP